MRLGIRHPCLDQGLKRLEPIMAQDTTFRWHGTSGIEFGGGVLPASTAVPTNASDTPRYPVGAATGQQAERFAESHGVTPRDVVLHPKTVVIVPCLHLSGWEKAGTSRGL